MSTESTETYQPNWRTVVFLWLYAFEHPDYQHRPPTKRRKKRSNINEQPDFIEHADQPDSDQP